jgi:hypothetical protein
MARDDNRFDMTFGLPIARDAEFDCISRGQGTFPSSWGGGRRHTARRSSDRFQDLFEFGGRDECKKSMCVYCTYILSSLLPRYGIIEGALFHSLTRFSFSSLFHSLSSSFTLALDPLSASLFTKLTKHKHFSVINWLGFESNDTRVDCRYSAWTAWSQCKQSCKTARRNSVDNSTSNTRSRSRTVIAQPKFGGIVHHHATILV